MQLQIDRSADTPIYRQIVDQIRSSIEAGTLPPGTRLPPVRRVADDLGLTRLTVYSAYSELQAQGLVDSHVGRGTFVSGAALPGDVRDRVDEGLIADLLRLGDDAATMSFAQAFPAPETVPVRELGRAFQSAARRPGALGYGPVQGHLELREQIAALCADRGFAVSPDGVLITAGAQQAIDVIFRACTEPGQVIAAEVPTYPGALELASLRSLRVIGIPSDEGGIRVDALEAACRAHRPRLLYLVPACSNPTGHSLAPERRRALLDLARVHDMLVVEDDIYGLLSFDASSPPALKSDDRGDVVLYLTSFSKMLAPGLRLGAVVPPAALLSRLVTLKGSTDLVCSPFLQLALAQYLRRGHLHPHLAHVRALYGGRCAVMQAAVERHLPGCAATQPRGGLSMWVRLPDAVGESEVVSEALDAGVAVVPGRAFFPDSHSGSFIRLSFSVQPPERIERGLATLGSVLERHLRRGTALRSPGRGAAGPLV
jgi:DNA-binding transcriptional MocR family regulator